MMRVNLDTRQWNRVMSLKQHLAFSSGAATQLSYSEKVLNGWLIMNEQLLFYLLLLYATYQGHVKVFVIL